MASAPASAVTVVTIVQVAPARAIAMATESATTTSAIATLDLGEKTAVMRFAVPIVCMVNASITNAFASKVSLDGIVTPAHVAAKSCSTQRQKRYRLKDLLNLSAVGMAYALLIIDVNVM
jgi:hypothetical protein